MDIADLSVKVTIGGNTFYFPAVKIWRRLEKNIILFKLPKKNVGRDLLRVTDSFKLSGTWRDDPPSTGKLYDGKTAFARYLRMVDMTKVGDPTVNQGPLCYLTWMGRTHKTRLKGAAFEKMPGKGTDMDYDLEFIKVTK